MQAISIADIAVFKVNKNIPKYYILKRLDGKNDSVTPNNTYLNNFKIVNKVLQFFLK